MEKLEARPNADHDMETLDEEQHQENIRCVHLFNCDETYKLDVVEELFEVVKTKLNFAISIQSHYFALRDMSQVCENIIPDQIKVDDFAVFVVHAHESRLSINEDNAGIGYAKIYRALLRATDGKVLIVIGGDDSYKDSAEEKNSFLSRWARRKISSQFSEEYLDGRKSFIFSWNKKHRPIHEEALLHYFDHFDPDKEEKKFVLVEKKEEETVSEGQKQQERTESDVEHRRTEGQSPETELQRGQKRGEQIAPQQLPRTEEGSPEDMEIVSHLSVEDEKHKNVGDVEKTFVIVSEADFSGKPAEAASVPTMDLKEMEAVKPPLPSLPQDTEVKDTPSLATEDSLPKTKPKRVRVEEMDTSPPGESIAILFRDESDIKTIEEVFGDALLGINPVTSRDPRSMKDLLQNKPVRSCFIIVESTKIKEESLTKSSSTVYQDLLKTASRIVEKKIVVILCSEGQNLTPGEEGSITATIKELLGEKGLTFWCKENNKTKRSHSPPASNLALSTHVERSINPEEFAPQKMTDNLLTERQTINSAELSEYSENKTGKERTAVRDLESRSKGALGQSGLTSVRERVVDGANAIGTEKDEDMADEEVPFVLVSPGDLQCLQEDSLPKAKPKRTRAKGMDTSPPQESIAILIRNESDVNTIKEVFGDVLPVTLSDPRSMKDLLLQQSTQVKSCFIAVESTKLLTKSSSKVYLELLKTANEFVEKKIVVILCSGGKSLTYSEEESITATIKEILGEKVLVFWCKGNNKTKRSSFIRSQSLPENPKNPEELVLKTRLLRGKISYDEKDVKKRVGEWTAPQEMADSLLRKWQNTESAELAVYRDLKTRNERTVVTEESRFKAALGRVGFTSDGANVSGWMSTGANVYDAIRQYGSDLMSGKVPGTEATGSNVSEDSRPEGSSNISSANSNQDLLLD